MESRAVCSACRGERDGDNSLGDACWARLRPESREALYRQDGKITHGYRQLREACEIGAPLSLLVIE